MSKKKKVSAKPAAKKKAAKPAGKPSKKVTKVSAKKPLKKASKVPQATKKTVSKVSKKAVKPAPKKSAPVKKSAAKNKIVAKKIDKKAQRPLTPAKKIVAAKASLHVNNHKTAGKPAAKAVVKNPVNNNKTSYPSKNNKPVIPSNGNKPAAVKVAKVLPAPVATKVPGKELRPQTASPVSLKTVKAEESKKGGAGKSNEVLAITNTIPVTKKNEISQSKIASISRSITNPVRKTDSYAVKAEKEPAGKFEMEFVLHSSSEMLYEFLSTASGLSEWFCDDLNIRNGIYTFIWDDQLQQARLLKTIELHIVRFQWVDKTDGSYFEFKIQKDDLTNDIALIITDFADTNSERESAKLLWQSQIEKLRHVIGSIF